MSGERSFDPSKTPGTFEASPPGAPHEVAQELSPQLVQEQLERARANEQVLPPFAPERRMGVPPPAALHATPRATPTSHQPAASSSDSPSRGVPRPISDPGKIITGGWGPSSEALYFPLDGTELRELVRLLLDKLNDRIENDLRFSPATTYPRARVTLTLTIDCVAGQSEEIQYVEVKEKTPMEIALQKGDREVYEWTEERREVAEDGSAENPPDRIRDELQLPKPRKHQVEGPGGRKAWVDVEPDPLSNIF